MPYPLHLLEARSNGLDLNKLLDAGKREATQAANRMIPAINREVQTIAETQAKKVISAVEGFIPSEQEMVQLAQRVTDFIQNTLNEEILPQIYNRSAELALSGVLFSDQELRALYDRAFQKIPTAMTFNLPLGQTITLNTQNIVKAALPFNKFQAITRKIEPFTRELESSAVPVVKNKVEDLAIFTLLTGMIVGGVVTFGYVKLYNSFDK